VIVITVICLGFSLDSIRRLEQRFDPTWFIPKDSYFADYLAVRKSYFPTNGFEAGIYTGSVNYSHELINIKNMVDDLSDQHDIALGVISWVDPFRNFVKINFQTGGCNTLKSSQYVFQILDVYNETLSEEYFNLYLSMFLFSARNAVYQANFRFDKPLECGVPAPKIIVCGLTSLFDCLNRLFQMSTVDFHFNQFKGPEEYLPAMHKVQQIAESCNFTTGDKFSTAWSKVFASWITDEVLFTLATPKTIEIF
jgi:Niemann-Pick C1 protein